MSASQPASANRAVFLSYASQDAEAAKRICEALRAAGVEVWFDQDALVGGDAWDAKIRGQIGSCALFIPVISAATQERLEGYFRLEWKLAANRSHTMAEEKAFLLPVVIDATRDAEGKVPTEFRSVQWTKLPGGETSTGFVTRVQQLLGGTIALVAAPVHASSQPSAPALAPKSGFLPWVSAALGVAVVALVAFVLLRPSSKDAAPAPKPVTETKPAPPVLPAPAVPSATGSAQSAAADKSIAVLAFANFGGDKENEYFSDGITEELLNVLAKVPGLRVAARTSAFYFKDKNVPIPEIAQKLNVAYVVEGSVQKSGTRVKITAQLIKASDGFHVWSNTFTRELQDVFAMQDEIAGLIAKQLQLTFGDAPRVTKSVDPEAHRLVLEGRFFWNQRNDEAFKRAEAAFTKAIELDPKYAEAHSGLAGVCVIRELYHQFDGFNDNAADSARAWSEAKRAIDLDPGLAEPHAVLGYAWQLQHGHLREAEDEFQKALLLNPNDPFVRGWHGVALSTEGRIDAALEYARAVELDPLWFINLQTYAWDLALAQRYDDAVEILKRASGIRTEVFITAHARIARLCLLLGRKDEAVMEARFVRQNIEVRPRWDADSNSILVLREAGLDREGKDFADDVMKRLPADSYARGFVLGALGRIDEALPYLERTPVMMMRSFYWDVRWDPWRDDPRFQQLLVKLDCVEEYKIARETLARLLQEQVAKK